MGPPGAYHNSPRFSSPLAIQHSQTVHAPSNRALPTRDVTDENIDDAYADFILYCNPYFPEDVDTAELKRVFRNPPKSDGKEFSIYRLWELIQKFDAKEIKTWAQLALDLGVEPPDPGKGGEKGGSVQKVQQYSVRLKRWMRAMHVDAFFEYLLGKKHSYFADLPPPHNPHPAEGRDGVPAEEDLAIRALDPSFRPKRGRKRNESPTEEDASGSKRPMLTTSFTFEGQTLYAQPQSAYPVSAIALSARPENYMPDPWTAASAVTPDSFSSRTLMPQSAVSTSAPQHLRWQMHGTPMTPHPMSAITPSTLADSAFDEPRSAITPSSRSRSRRKHGPAVSSAWPSSNNSGSKLRGRPPGNRTMQDGPFSTFPVDPNAEKTPSTGRPALTPTVALMPSQEDRSPLLRPNTYTGAANQSRAAATREGAPQTKQRLSLQVPEHVGGPVHLVTPTVLVNGENNGSNSSDASRRSTPAIQDRHTRSIPGTTPSPSPEVIHAGTALQTSSEPGFAYEALKRSLAADLLRADFSGRLHPPRLSGEEAKGLSDAILKKIGVPEADTENKRDDALRISSASWLGLSSTLGFSAGSTLNGKKVVVRRFILDHKGYEVPIPEDLNPGLEMEVREYFDVSWQLGFGGVSGDFSVKGVQLGEKQPSETEKLENNVMMILDSNKGKRDDEVDWKAEYRALELGARMMKGQTDEMRERVLDAILRGPGLGFG
ncbi:hypothetical protein M8818_006168 [Zalaria obscura]|uniref:Uncharacterized protein n=1 Tax=Zalaria obscura TaxID=2024903 RepID=A0ACC3S7P9_9PEZI